MPVIFAYAAVALAGIIIAGVVASKIAAHLDGTAASDAYSDAMVKRQQGILALVSKGASVSEATKAMGSAPKQPAGMGLGAPTLLIGAGAAAVGVAIFWKPLSRLFKLKGAA